MGANPSICVSDKCVGVVPLNSMIVMRNPKILTANLVRHHITV